MITIKIRIHSSSIMISIVSESISDCKLFHMWFESDFCPLILPSFFRRSVLPTGPFNRQFWQQCQSPRVVLNYWHLFECKFVGSFSLRTLNECNTVSKWRNDYIEKPQKRKSLKCKVKVMTVTLAEMIVFKFFILPIIEIIWI